MSTIDRTAIAEAYARIRSHLRRTPVIALERGAFGVDACIELKLELTQHTGSFKPRGAFNAMLSARLPAAGVIAASGGNHGAAVAYAAQRLGVPAEIFVPTIASAAKVERIRRCGATLTVTGASYAETLAACEARTAASGALPIHAYDQPETVCGQGSVAQEIEEQTGLPDALLVAVGGGGLVGGVAAWCAGRCRVIAVEPERAPSLYAARQAGRPVDVEVGGIAADSLGARRIGSLAFAIAATHVADAVLVPDDAIVAAQRALWGALRIVAEPGGATALAALISGAWRPRPGERVGVIVCGGNTSLPQFEGVTG